jgi:tetratricopeptide (TPR) repeat protein
LAAAHQNWAKIWMIRRDYANAAEHYRLAQEADSTYDAARWCRIWTSNLAGRPDVAEREGAALLREFPNAWRVRYHRSLALALLGRRDEALRELNAIADEAPEEDGVARGARFYASRIGGPDEADALAAYLRQADS